MSESSANDSTLRVALTPQSNQQLANFCGPIDANLAFLAERLGVAVQRVGFELTVSGELIAVKRAATAVRELYDAALSPLGPDSITLMLAGKTTAGHWDVDDAEPTASVLTPRLTVNARGQRQTGYLRQIAGNDLTFGVGPAGTGKTFLAVSMAVQALIEDGVQRIVLARPAVEAGERLGFLPGDLAQKVDPYLRPLYDALYDMLGVERVGKLIERNVIEIAPLAYMRGRTLSDAFIILDEAQNTTVEQMKMLLTRLGFGSRLVVTGDMTQIDLPRSQRSGLRHALSVLRGVDGVAVTEFQASDVVRHPLVRRIVDAYARDSSAPSGSDSASQDRANARSG